MLSSASCIISTARSDATRPSRSCDNAQVLFDDFVATASQVAADVAQKWNRRSSAIVRRFPPEVLAECFSYQERNKRSRNGKRVNGVSRLFRQITLEMPSIWRRIVGSVSTKNDLAILSAFLERSGQGSELELTIKDVALRCLDDTVKVLSSYLPRVCWLKTGSVLLLEDLYPATAPMLEVLVVECCGQPVVI